MRPPVVLQRTLAEAFKARSKATYAPSDDDLQFEREAIRPLPPLHPGVGAAAYCVDFSHALLRNLDALAFWQPPLSEDRQVRYIVSLCVELRLRCNDLVAVPPDTLSRWAALRTLDLSVNQLPSLASGALTLAKLRTLDVSQNKLRRLEGLEGLPSLTQLDASMNEIAELGPELAPLTALRSLNLAGNTLEAVADGFQSLTALETLQLQRNRLGSIRGLVVCTSLVTLNIAENRLADLKHVVTTLAPLPRLATLTASGNPVSGEGDYRFAALDLPALATFDGLPVRAATREKLAELRRHAEARGLMQRTAHEYANKISAERARTMAQVGALQERCRQLLERMSAFEVGAHDDLRGLLAYLDRAARGGVPDWSDSEGHVAKLRAYLLSLAEERAKRAEPSLPPVPPRAAPSPVSPPAEPSVSLLPRAPPARPPLLDRPVPRADEEGEADAEAERRRRAAGALQGTMPLLQQVISSLQDPTMHRRMDEVVRLSRAAVRIQAHWRGFTLRRRLEQAGVQMPKASPRLPRNTSVRFGPATTAGQAAAPAPAPAAVERTASRNAAGQRRVGRRSRSRSRSPQRGRGTSTSGAAAAPTAAPRPAITLDAFGRPRAA